MKWNENGEPLGRSSRSLRGTCRPQLLAQKVRNVSNSSSVLQVAFSPTHSPSPIHCKLAIPIPTMAPKPRSQISPNAQTVPPIPKPASTITKNTSSQSAQEILASLWNNYLNTTPQRVKLIDVFMAFLIVVGGLQFVYCVLVGNYVSCAPFFALRSRGGFLWG